MEFQHPIYLILLIIIPILIFWNHQKGRHNQGVIQISSKLFTSDSMRKSGRIKKNTITITYFIIILLIIFGIARPRKIDTIMETSVSVIDMLLVLDISSSMLAVDFSPNRLEAVKKTAIDFIDNRKEDRIGILVFAGESFIQCPLTVDKSILVSLINEIKVASKEYDGTAIGMAIANGVNRFRNSDVKSKVMILLSDGSNNAGEIDPITAAELAKEFDVKIYTIGAGTNQNLVPYPGRGLVPNEIDEVALKKIASVTGGKYFRATDVKALSSIYAEINDMEKSEIQVNRYTQYKELYGWFLIPAVMISVLMELLRRIYFRMVD